MKKYILLLLLVCAYQFCSAQLIFSPLYENRIIKEHLLKANPDKHFKSVSDTLELPFFDDFSRTDIFPNTSLWLDRLVFINNSYSNYIGNTTGNNAPSINVATFDGFDDKGNTYSNNPNVYGNCDTLTSKPINLTPADPNNPTADSVYLSFYIQPKGTGLNLQPERMDSLVLQFKSPGSGTWLPAAAYRGYTTQEIQQGKVFPFLLKMIPINDTNYLKKGFQFRFINKGSLYGADDIWNIDYIKLGKGRSRSDSLLPDASFNANPGSFMKNYTAVPFNQYSPTLIADNHLVAIRNNFDINKTLTLTYTAYNITENNTFIDSTSRGVSNLPAYSTSYEASEKFSFPELNKETVIRTRYNIVAPDDNYINNDTIELYTNFKDYFAYDDGTAEGGIGLKTTGDGRFAVEFELKEPDTITSVKMYFNRFLKNVSQNLFTLTIWKSISIGGEGQDIAYQKTTLRPKYDSLADGFAEFSLDDSIVVLPAGKFYVGWVQNIDYDLNLGFDQNTDNGSKIFYNVSSAGWQQANIYGAPMIRPVFKNGDGNTGTGSGQKYSDVINIYPNPTNGLITISYKPGKDHMNYLSYTVDVYDLLGKKKINNTNSPETIDMTAFEKGIYFLQLTDHFTNKTYTSKVIKN
jgi:hypothetical protein